MIRRNLVVALIVGTALLFGGVFFWNRQYKEVSLPSEEELPRATEEEEVERIRLVFTGDVMLSRSVGAKMEKYGDYGFPARKVADFFKDADIVVVNLEGPISVRGTDVGSQYSFRANPRTIETLMLLNVSVASLANNHMWDYGCEALVNTADILKASRILPVGAGENHAEANALRVMEAGGIKFGFLSYTNLYPKNLEAGANLPGISSFNLENTVAEIKARKDPLSSAGISGEKADILIVLFHWGEEYKNHPTKEQENIAHALIDAGADLVIGHHPHVVQDAEEYKGKWIFYSLGNFIFDQYFSEDTMKGLVVEAFAEINPPSADDPIKEGKITEVKLWESTLNKEYQVESISPK